MSEILDKLTIKSDATLREAMAAIDAGAKQVALVVDGSGTLLATVTDGDLRRGLLRGLGMDDPVNTVMQTNFTAIGVEAGRDAARRLMQEKSFHHVPIVDPLGRLVDLAHIDDVTGITRNDTQVVLMAGGLGTRLRPLTETVPKPMLPIGGRPILEVILKSFVDQGFYRFSLSVNYKADMIEAHFGDGSAFGAEIDYVHETQPMGTAGALSLLPSRPSAPFIVMNGDLLTSLNFGALLQFHRDTGASATMCAREFNLQVPYGVVETDGTALQRVVEKPTHSHFVNAGIYALSPDALDLVDAGVPLDMPSLFNKVMKAKKTASVFPINEYWIDIGRMEDLERARSEFQETFG